VAAVISENVEQGPADLGRSRQGAGVIAIGEHSSAAAELLVEAFREPDDEALQPAPQRLTVVGLADQVPVVALHGEVNEPKAETVAADPHRRAKRRHSRFGA
jgi:hypothetical protein